MTVIFLVDRFRCGDCKTKLNTMDNSFMVPDELYDKYVPERMNVCQVCFEVRLGRPLERSDLGRYSIYIINHRVGTYAPK